MNINIGGGRRWIYSGWQNLDQSRGTKFTPETVFRSGEADIIYSSHCFEHLDDETVDQMLKEARRVGKTLVLKLPDFEQVLERWEAGDNAYFEKWGQGGVIPTWKNMGVVDSIHARAAMIFCGWWNDEYGDEWGDRHPDRPGAYHGPADCDHARVLAHYSYSPHELAAAFRDLVWEENPHFNHQNAWSYAELEELVEEHGWTVVTMDKSEICETMPIPTIRDMYGISMYLKAR